MKREMIYNRNFQKALAVFSFVCFALSLAIHLFAVFGVNIIKDGWVFLFHAVLFIPFGILVVVSQPQFKLYKSTVDNDYQKWFFSPMPRWTKYAAYTLGVYVLINFIFCILLISTVKAEKLDGKFVLIPIKAEVSAKNVIREISEQEYELQNSYETRFFSGHWMIFYLMPALFFWYKRENPIWTTNSNLEND